MVYQPSEEKPTQVTFDMSMWSVVSTSLSTLHGLPLSIRFPRQRVLDWLCVPCYEGSTTAQESNPCLLRLLHWEAVLPPLSHLGSEQKFFFSSHLGGPYFWWKAVVTDSKRMMGLSQPMCLLFDNSEIKPTYFLLSTNMRIISS